MKTLKQRKDLFKDLGLDEFEMSSNDLAKTNGGFLAVNSEYATGGDASWMCTSTGGDGLHLPPQGC